MARQLKPYVIVQVDTTPDVTYYGLSAALGSASLISEVVT
jgi:hypothetical protein